MFVACTRINALECHSFITCQDIGSRWTGAINLVWFGKTESPKRQLGELDRFVKRRSFVVPSKFQGTLCRFSKSSQLKNNQPLSPSHLKPFKINFDRHLYSNYKE
jgi:hypothetical protein